MDETIVHREITVRGVRVIGTIIFTPDEAATQRAMAIMAQGYWRAMMELMQCDSEPMRILAREVCGDSDVE